MPSVAQMTGLATVQLTPAGDYFAPGTSSGSSGGHKSLDDLLTALLEHVKQHKKSRIHNGRLGR